MRGEIADVEAQRDFESPQDRVIKKTLRTSALSAFNLPRPATDILRSGFRAPGIEPFVSWLSFRVPFVSWCLPFADVPSSWIYSTGIPGNIARAVILVAEAVASVLNYPRNNGNLCFG